MNNIVLIGASEHAKVVMDVIEKEGKYKIYGLIDSFKPAGEKVFGYEILGTEDKLVELFSSGKVTSGLITIGDNWTRFQMAEKVLKLLPDFQFVSSVHPSANIARGVTIGVGSVLMAGVVVNSDSTIGDFCIMNTRSSLDHDSVMGDFSSLAPGATTGGKVAIGSFSVVSLGASVVHSVNIGEHTVLGAGALVLQDVPAHCVAYGVPAKVVRTRQAGEKYL